MCSSDLQASQDSQKGRQWLESNGLEAAPRLVEKLEVEQGWEAATETVLGFWLDSVMVDDTQALSGSLAQLSAADNDDVTLTLLSSGSTGVAGTPGSLAEKATAPDVIIEQLNQVRVAESLEAAFALVAGSDSGISAITQDGHWVGSGWIRVSGDRSGQAGMLARKQEIRELQDEISALQQQWKELDQANQAEREALSAAENGIATLQQQVNELHRDSAALDSRLQAGQSRIEELDSRQKQVAE